MNAKAQALSETADGRQAVPADVIAARYENPSPTPAAVDYCICDESESVPPNDGCAFHGSSVSARLHQSIVKTRELLRELEAIKEQFK